MRLRPLLLLFCLSLTTNSYAGQKSLFVIVTLDGFGANRLSPSLNKQVMEKYGNKKEAKQFFQLPPLPFLKKLSHSPDVLYLEKGIEPVFPSITNTNHASLMTGKDPREHQLLGNYYAEKVPGLGYKMVSFPASFRPEFYDEIQPPPLLRKRFNIGSVFWPSTSSPKTHDPRFSIPEIFSLSLLAPEFQSRTSLFAFHNWDQERPIVPLEDYLQLLHGQSVVKSKTGTTSLCTEDDLRTILKKLLSGIEDDSFYRQFSETLKRVEESCPADSQVPPRVALRFFLDIFDLRKGMEAAGRLTEEGRQPDSLLFLHFIGTDTAQHENKGVSLSFELTDFMMERYTWFLEKISSTLPVTLILTADHGMSFIEKNIFLEKFLIESGKITFNDKKGVGYLFDKTFDKKEADKYYSLTTPAYWGGVSGMLYSLRVTDPRQTQKLVNFIHQGSFPGKEYLGDCYWWDLSSKKSVLRSMIGKPIPESVTLALSNPRHSDIAPHILCTPSDGQSFFAQAKKMEGGLLKEKTVVNKGWHGYFPGKESPEINSLFLVKTFSRQKNKIDCIREKFEKTRTVKDILSPIEGVTLKAKKGCRATTRLGEKG